jgi:hypothetical protein
MSETKEIDDGSPGSHPHSNRPNWQPGDDAADELLRQIASRCYVASGRGERT